MTLAGAISTARGMAPRFGKSFNVFRMPGFAPDTYAVLPVDRELPANAEIVETWHRDGSSTRQGSRIPNPEPLEPAGDAAKRLPVDPAPPEGMLF